MTECIEEIARLNLSDTISEEINFIASHLNVESNALERIKTQLKSQLEIQEKKAKTNEMSLTFQDLNSDCVDAILTHLSLSEKFSVERVSKSWQESVKRTLISQRNLILVSSSNSETFKSKYDFEIVYQKSTAPKIISFLPNIEKLTFVGFDINYQKFSFIKKFTKLNGISFLKCKIAEKSEWRKLTIAEIEGIKIIEFCETKVSDTFMDSFFPKAFSLKTIMIKQKSDNVVEFSPDVSFNSSQWMQLFQSMPSTIDFLFISSFTFPSFLKNGLRRHKKLLTAKLQNLKDLALGSIEIELLSKLVPLMPKLKKLSAIISADKTSKITGRHLQAFNSLGYIKLMLEPDANFDTLSLVSLSNIPIFSNLKRFSLINFKTNADDLKILCGSIPKIASLVLLIDHIECECLGKGMGICLECCADLCQRLSELKRLKGLILCGFPRCKSIVEALLESESLPQLQFLKVEREIVRESFLKAVFEFAVKKPKEEFVLDTHTKLQVSVAGKPRNVTIVP